jgi:hypothetical protein
MGYTHYWTVKRAFTDNEWERIADSFALLVANTDVPLHPCTADAEHILFNGGCETFLLERSAVEFAFCKTRQLPYDAIVVAVLSVARTVAPDAVELDSDGGVEVFA